MTFLMAYAVPTLGMERVALDVASELAAERNVRVVAVAGTPPSLPGVSSSSLGLAPRRFAMAARWWRIFRHFDVAPEQTIVLVGPWLAVPALLVPRFRRNRLVVWEHSLMREQIETTPARRTLWTLARRLYRRADAIVAVSKPLAQDLASTFGTDSVHVIPNLVSVGMSPVRRLDREPSDVYRAISVGSLTANKRHALAIDAVAATPDLLLDIFGDGPERAALEAQVAASGASDRIRLHGHELHDRVMLEVSNSDVMVHPSAGETFGLVFIEAAELGVPVIAAANRVTNWLIPDFVPGQTFDSAEQLREILASRILVTPTEVARAAEARTSEFDRTAVVAAWNGLLSSMGPN
ncbi:glycosyltransferase [Nocardioides sp. GCM10028917]|uniref:glycosyltransferase n=1 Tax=Nocardioides sp. GCM10028917 TaxID=3273408 RepID=UPI003614808B